MIGRGRVYFTLPLGDIGQSVSGGLSAQQAFSFLPPDVQIKLSTAANSFQAAATSAAPFISLAQHVGAGGLDEGQAVAALSLVASAVGGPIGGAAMAAAGGLVLGIETGLHSLFDALGLYDHSPVYQYVGYRRRGLDVLPWGVDDPDWWHIRSISDLYSLLGGHMVSPSTGKAQPPISGVVNDCANEIFADLLQQMQTLGSSPTWPHTQLDAFEKFFYPMLVKNLEMWANGSGFIPPRTLLSQAAAAWNGAHAASPTKVYSPVDFPDPAHQFLAHSVVDMTLGSCGAWDPGNPTRSPPLTVNMGPASSTPKKVITLHLGHQPTPVAAPASASTAVVAGTVAAVVASAAGATWYVVGGRAIRRALRL
jgi:hypothetical protein